MSDRIHIIQFPLCAIMWFLAGLFSCESVAVHCIKLCATLASVYYITEGKTSWCWGYESSLVPTPRAHCKVIFQRWKASTPTAFTIQQKLQPAASYVVIFASCTSEMSLYWKLLPSAFSLWGCTVGNHPRNDHKIRNLLRIEHSLALHTIPA